jgi:hypothetical protein
MGKGLSKRRREQLARALESLPEPIRYLRGPILLTADQDQDLLGNGEADPALLDAIFDARNEGSGPALEPEEAADLLREWLEGFAIDDFPWLAPAGFVEGALRGQAMFDTDEEPPPPPKILLGLQRTDFDIPAGLKTTKLYDRGIGLKNREVQIIIGEADDQSWEIRHPKRNAPPAVVDTQVPHIRWETTWDIAIGPWTVCKVISRNLETGLPVSCTYFMTASEVKIEAGIFSSKLTGSDLSKYEAVLASIRLK